MAQQWFRWLIVVMWCIMIFNFTASPTSTSANTGKIITQETNLPKNEVKQINIVVRKNAHVLVFGILALLLWWSNNKKRHSFIIAWFLTTAYAATDEFHQLYVPNRTASVDDVVLDSFGAFITLLLVYCLKQKYLKKGNDNR